MINITENCFFNRELRELHVVFPDGNKRQSKLAPIPSQILISLMESESGFISKSDLIKRVWCNGIVSDQSICNAVYKIDLALKHLNVNNGIKIVAINRSGYCIERTRLENQRDCFWVKIVYWVKRWSLLK
jgi:DNA-binding winged helix-turn-helix (wHTH) protein